jgi:hypothetical protein
MLNADYYMTSDPLFEQLYLFKLNDIYEFEMAKFMHNYDMCSLPCPLLNLFTNTRIIHDHQTRQCEHLRPINCRLSITFNSILYKGPHIWNALPEDIRTKKHLLCFKNSLKNIILQMY